MPHVKSNDSQPLYIIDTDILTYLQQGRPGVVERFRQASPEKIATTIITMQEQLQGRLAYLHRQKDPSKLQNAYKLLQETQNYFCKISVLPFESEAAKLYFEQISNLALENWSLP